ncbi:MAG: ATP-binding protein [Chlamydiia bacterium]|nr:ATP-binding protein [Chlamydiia bacterium]
MNEEALLPILIGEFDDKLTTLEKLFERDKQFPEAPNKIKVAIGMRRAGKTYFVYQHILKLLGEGVERERILFINFEDDRLLPLNQKKLAKLIEAFYTLYPENHDHSCYLFFDEIQNVEDWPLVIRRLHDSKRVEIFLTGSSAKLLSKEIATTLRGRSLATEIWPYSFEEFRQVKHLDFDKTLFDKKTQDHLNQQFLSYLIEGGFPEVIDYFPDIRQQTLQEYVDIVIFRDMIERHEIKNPSLIKYMILKLLHNIGNPFSINKLFNDVKSQGHRIGKDTLYDYVEIIADTYLLFFVPIHDQSLRRVQANPKKVYAIDPGLIRAITLDYEEDLGRIFENVIFLDLKRRGYQIHYYLTEERYEVDFLIKSPRGEQKLIQVVWDMDNEKTYEREHRALEAAKKELNLPGEIITRNSYLQSGIPS